MTLHISSLFTYDEDAGNYIQAVEASDGQALAGSTTKAINNFVIGCKQDGIWNAIKASCILAGARTLAGALVPLVGTKQGMQLGKRRCKTQQESTYVSGELMYNILQ